MPNRASAKPALRFFFLAIAIAIAFALSSAFTVRALADSSTSSTLRGDATTAAYQAAGLPELSDDQSNSVPQTQMKPFAGKGIYFVSAAASPSRALGMKGSKRVEGASVVLGAKSNTNLLKFKITPAGKGLHYIANVATGRLLTADVDAGAKSGSVRMQAKLSRPRDVAKRQKWRIDLCADGSVFISHPKSGLVLSVAGAKVRTGAKLKLTRAARPVNERASSQQLFKLDKTRKNAKETVKLDVPCLRQKPELPTGCESVALTNALNYWGFGLRKTTIASRWLPYGENGVTNFIGSPFSNGGWIICAPGIANTANRYLAKQKVGVRALNVTGTNLKGLRKYLDKGYPVVVWTTINMRSPWGYDGSRRSGGRSYPFYHNNHAVVLSGYNPKTGAYLVSDSISGKVWRKGKAFERIYNTMGKQAVVLHDGAIASS